VHRDVSGKRDNEHLIRVTTQVNQAFYTGVKREQQWQETDPRLQLLRLIPRDEMQKFTEHYERNQDICI
jgi:hypothetical protein